MEDSCWSSLLLKDFIPWKGTHNGEDCGGLFPVGGFLCRSRGRTPLPEEEVVAETTHDELTMVSISYLSVSLSERR